MKIAFVTETWRPSTDGVVTRIESTIRELKRLGHTVLVIAPSGGEPDYEGTRVQGVPHVGVFFIYGGKPWGLPLPRVQKFLDAFQPDIVHVVNPFVLGIAGVWAAKKRQYSLVASYHTNIAQYADFYHLGFAKPFVWAVLRALHNRAAINLATSAAVKGELEAHGIQRVHVWRRAVDVDLFHPKRRDLLLRDRLTHGHPERKIALYVGRIALEKAIYRLEPLFDNAKFQVIMVGNGPAYEQLKRQYQSEHVTFTGVLKGLELAKVYASSDFFVFPSTTETLGLVLLEAMASGLPIVAAESGPTHELLDEAGAGLIYAPDSAAMLMTQIGRLIEDRELHAQLSQAARWEAEKWGWQPPTKELVALYEEARAYVPSSS